MADDNNSGVKVDPIKVVGFLILAVFVYTVVGNLFTRNSFFRYFYQPELAENGGSFSDGFLPADNPKLGKSIINKVEATIRQAPGGNKIGFQDKLIYGRLVEGPVFLFGTEWWRIDYPSAPDGWVEIGDFTNKIFTFSLLNIIPLGFGAIRPIFMILIFVLLILIAIVWLKRVDLESTIRKKNEVRSEQAMLKTGHIAEVMENEKPLEEDDLPIPNLPIGERPKTEEIQSRRWSSIQSLIRSYNANDWKQAIIEADIILEEMVDKMGYHGDTLGDKMKKIEPSDFTTINQAWEAHKFRNRIAHSRDYVLSKDEAERIIGLYEQVFREFFYI